LSGALEDGAELAFADAQLREFLAHRFDLRENLLALLLDEGDRVRERRVAVAGWCGGVALRHGIRFQNCHVNADYTCRCQPACPPKRLREGG
jgi:hypothetical protein